MGCRASSHVHSAEKEMFVKDLPHLVLMPQDPETFADLETEEDFKGWVIVDHVYTRTRQVLLDWIHEN
jgi:hypothetical protein